MWGLLTDKAVERHCKSKSGTAAYILVSSPFTTFLSPAGPADPTQVLIALLKSITSSNCCLGPIPLEADS